MCAGFEESHLIKTPPYTNMLTWQQLEELCRDGRLVRWKIGGREVGANGRGLYMLPEVHQQLSARPWPASNGEHPNHTRDRRTAMRQVLERFVLGAAIRVKYDIKELGSERSDEAMRGYWEFRSQGRMTETRLFGFFVRPGAFLATAFCGRDEFSKASHWVDRRVACEALWKNLCSGSTYILDPWPVVDAEELNSYLVRSDD